MEKIKNLSEPNHSISFNTKTEEESILKLCANGDIFVKGKLVENDLEVVVGMREFLKKASQTFTFFTTK